MAERACCYTATCWAFACIVDPASTNFSTQNDKQLFLSNGSKFVFEAKNHKIESVMDPVYLLPL